MTKLNKRPVVLIIRDGWGHNPYPQWNHANAIFLARHPVSDELMANYPSTLIHTSGFDVGLPEATMGNSEVGHQNIGAGRIVDQPAVKISKDVRDGNFLANSELNKACDFALQNHGALHLFGIVSDAGVHGLMEHLYGCLQLAAKRGLNRVYLHAFTDGRDTAPSAGIGYIQQVQAKMNEIGVGRIATVSGRYYAMDRDNRWSRVEKAYQAIANGVGPTFLSATEAVQFYYDHPTEPTMTGDEFVPPSVIVEGGKPIATVNDGDAVIFSDEAERVFKAQGLDAFIEHETRKVNLPLKEGPLKPLLASLHRLQKAADATTPMRIRTALVTARSAPAHERAIRTLMEWNIEIDEAMFLGGLDKGRFLREFEPDFFFDDQISHCESALGVSPTGHVPNGIANMTPEVDTPSLFDTQVDTSR